MPAKKENTTEFVILRDIWTEEGDRATKGSEVELPMNDTTKAWIKEGKIIRKEDV